MYTPASQYDALIQHGEVALVRDRLAKLNLLQKSVVVQLHIRRSRTSFSITIRSDTDCFVGVALCVCVLVFVMLRVYGSQGESIKVNRALKRI